MIATVLTWTLIVGSANHRFLVFHPDLATLLDCERLQQSVVANRLADTAKCVQVNKVVVVSK
jgi:hypothetical protein